MTFDLEKALEKNELEKRIKNDDIPYEDVLKGIAQIPLQGEQEPYIKLLAEERNVKEANIVADLKKIQRDNVKQRKKDTPQDNPTAMFPGLVDIVDHEGETAFLVLDGDELQIKSHHEHDGIVFKPPENMQWLLPCAEEVVKHYKQDSLETLYNDLVAYHKSISELPTENHYHLLALWDFHTYLFEQFEYSPYIWFYAIPERGKTRTGKGCIYVAWRGLDIESVREANLLRYAQNLKATLFFDVLDLWKKAEKASAEDILLKRFEKGATVSRVLYPEKGPHKDMVHFKIYGPTVIATNEQVSEILATRTIQIIMPEGSKRFETDVKPEMGLPYRERLTAFRAKYMNELLPDAEKPTRGRLGDILRPLRQMVRLVCPQEEQRFLEMVKTIEQDRTENLSETIEAKLIEGLLELEGEFEYGRLAAKILGDKLNEELPERRKRSQAFYTRKIKSMGLKAPRIGGPTCILWDEKLIRQLAQRYLGKSAQTAQSAQMIDNNKEFMSTFDEQKCADLKSAQELHEKCTGKNDPKTTGCAERAECAEKRGGQLDIFRGEV